MNPQEIESIGTAHHIKIFGDWGIAEFIDQKFKVNKITGNVVVNMPEGAEIKIIGHARRHAKYGDSIEVSHFERHIPLQVDALVRFIADNYKGIGDRSARKFIKGIDDAQGVAGLKALRNQLLHEPWAVDFSSIKRQGTFETGDEELAKTAAAYIQRDLALRLSGLPHRVLSALAVHLAGTLLAASNAPTDLVARAWSLLARDPYQVIPLIPGYGFLLADSIGQQAGIAREEPARLAALVAHAVVQRCETEGHVFLLFTAVKAAVARIDPLVDVDEALECALRARTIQLDEDADRIYPGRLLQAECSLARSVAALCRWSAPLLAERQPDALRDEIQALAKVRGGDFQNGLDPSQLAAVAGILTSKVRLHTITAAPGCGKTSVVEILAAFLAGRRFVFCAPTGKGAKVLSNRVASLGHAAQTINSLLRGDVDGGFSADQIDADVLIIDEGSMPDLRLADALLSRVGPSTHVVLLGDADQLPSIAPGRVLADLLAVPQVDHHRLETTHRNAGAILDTVRAVKAGDFVPVSAGTVTFVTALPPPEAGFPLIVAQYIDAVGRSGYAGVALLMSRRKGDIDQPGWNTTYANAVLREVCNPNAPRVAGSTLQVGDRIIIKANLKLGQQEGGREVRVVNGDTGRIRSFKRSVDPKNAGAEHVTIDLDDGRSIDLPGEHLSALQLGYALTVHAAQGSEYKDVIAVITPGAPTFINRNTIYTAFSRARSRLQVYADGRELVKIARTPMPVRNSMLTARVAEAIRADQDDAAEEQDVL